MTDVVERGNVRVGGAALVLLSHVLLSVSPFPTGPLVNEPLVPALLATAYFVVLMVTLVVPGSVMLAAPDIAVKADKARSAVPNGPAPVRLLLAGSVWLIVMVTGRREYVPARFVE